MNSLKGKTSGVYKVYTESSSYIINLNRGLVKRVPGVGMALDGDYLWIGLKDVYAVVGEIMHLSCSGLHPEDVYTWRRTTTVQRIEKIDGRKKV
jgi:hypothetical protein